MITVERGYVHEIEFQSIGRGEQPARDLARLRVNIDRSFRDGENEDGSTRYNHDKDFWINVEMWGPRVRALRGIVNKGARVLMTGRYDNTTWTDQESKEARSRMVFVASHMAIDPHSVESIAYKQKNVAKDSGSETAAAQAAS